LLSLLPLLPLLSLLFEQIAKATSEGSVTIRVENNEKAFGERTKIFASIFLLEGQRSPIRLQIISSQVSVNSSDTVICKLGLSVL